MITLQSLGLTIDDKAIFKDLCVSFLPSSIVCLKGKNGAGKTSLLKILAGIMQPSEGKILFNKGQFPLDILPKPYCTYIGHNLAIKKELSVLDNMIYWSSLFDSEMLINVAINYLKLGKIVDQRAGELSEGMRKKVSLARLILCPTKLWLLDEIDSNLDSDNRELLTRLIIAHADSGGYVFMATHSNLDIKTAVNFEL